MPATAGVAIDVPDIAVRAHVAIAGEPELSAELSGEPGPTRSGLMRPSVVGPRDEKSATVVVGSAELEDAPTAMLFLASAGAPIPTSVCAHGASGRAARQVALRVRLRGASGRMTCEGSRRARSRDVKARGA